MVDIHRQRYKLFPMFHVKHRFFVGGLSEDCRRWGGEPPPLRARGVAKLPPQYLAGGGGRPLLFYNCKQLITSVTCGMFHVKHLQM